jgi:hypothetical protein
LYGHRLRDRAETPPTAPAAPRIDTDLKAQLARLRAEQLDRLSGYAWADRDTGFAQIPVDRAMAAIASAKDPYAPLEHLPADQPSGQQPTGQPR